MVRRDSSPLRTADRRHTPQRPLRQPGSPTFWRSAASRTVSFSSMSNWCPLPSIVTENSSVLQLGMRRRKEEEENFAILDFPVIKTGGTHANRRMQRCRTSGAWRQQKYAVYCLVRRTNSAASLLENGLNAAAVDLDLAAPAHRRMGSGTGVLPRPPPSRGRWTRTDTIPRRTADRQTASHRLHQHDRGIRRLCRRVGRRITPANPQVVDRRAAGTTPNNNCAAGTIPATAWWCCVSPVSTGPASCPRTPEATHR